MSVGAVNKQTGERIPTAGMPAVDSVLSGVSTNPVQNRVVKAALDEKADTDMVAADFDATASYTAGNYCVQDGKLYKFKNNHSGAWSSADVDEVKITGELSALKSGLNDLISGKTIADGVQPTLLAGQHYGAGCYYFKVGCFVYLYISVQFESAPSNVKIFSLPLGYIPVSLSEISVSGGESYNAKAQCVISEYGHVSVTSADKYVTGSGILLAKATT